MKSTATASAALAALLATSTLAESPLSEAATGWRNDHRVVDLHFHLGPKDEHVRRAVAIMDQAGIGLAANLSGGYTTPGPDGISALQRTKARADKLAPGRFVHYMNLDYRGWDDPGFSDRAVAQIEAGHRLGAAGLKEYKRLGLTIRDRNKKVVSIDDPKLDPVWKRCGELGMPVSIHVADPKAFWEPYDENNERWTELKDHKSWWFGDPEKYPPRMQLLEALDRVIARHPDTTFVCVHFANNAEDIAWVEAALDRRPNMHADIAARVPEIGRHDPAAVRRLFTKHRDRILFASDFMVYDRLVLGSGGSGPGPSDADALTFFHKHWRWFETADRNFAHMTPIQGDWTIDAIDLPDDVLRQVYFENARELLVRSLPAPRTTAAKTTPGAIKLDGVPDEPEWAIAPPLHVESQITTGEARPRSGATARVLWTDTHLLVSFSAPFEKLTTFPDPGPAERSGLWDRDVVEVFVTPGDATPSHYFEYEVAPTGEKLDLRIEKPDYDLSWNGDFAAAAHIHDSSGVYTAELKIPFTDFGITAPPAPGDGFRLNLYRHDVHHKAFTAWHPTHARTAHRPERFGYLTLGGN